jgi:hypothetical protein
MKNGVARPDVPFFCPILKFGAFHQQAQMHDKRIGNHNCENTTQIDPGAPPIELSGGQEQYRAEPDDENDIFYPPLPNARGL